MGCFLFVRIFFDIPDIFFQRCSVFWFAINPKSPFLEQTLSRSFYWDWSFGPFAMNGPFFLSLHWWIPHLLWLDPNTTMAWFYGTGWFWPFGSQHHFIVERCWNYSMTSWWYIYILHLISHTIWLPSTKHTENYGTSPWYKSTNFLWSFSMANC
jgi:hypothetical protein